MKPRNDLGYAEADEYDDEAQQAADTLRELREACSMTLNNCGPEGDVPKAYILGVSVECPEPNDVRLMLHSAGVGTELLTLLDTMAADLLLSMLREGIRDTDAFTMVMSRLSTILRYTELPRAALRRNIEEALGSRPDLYRREHGREHGDAQEQTGPSSKRTLN